MDNIEDQKEILTPEGGEQDVRRIPGRDLYEWVHSLAAAVLIIVIMFTFFVRMMGVQGPSMRQTLQDGDRLFVLNSHLVREYRQGDIVIARKQSFSDDPIVKRIIAVEGQTIDIDFSVGAVYVDGVELEEDYINDLTYTFEGTQFPLTVPEGSVFLMGDNRNMSTDSREPRIGTVDKRYLIGKVIFLAFPGPDSVTDKREFGRIGVINKR
ncbi:MAG: signal peptidase I [Oscillospiraceae bacterium]|nr:signal peptidase I [Oscillospiraceae bacterium]